MKLPWNLMKLYLTKKNKHLELEKELFNKNHPQAKMRMPWNIYTPGSTKYEFVTKFHWIHFFFKDKLCAPALIMVNRLFGKKLDKPKELPDYPYNEVMRIPFEEWEEAIIDWNVMMLGRKSHYERKFPTEHFVKQAETHASSEMLRTMNRMLLTLANNDNVYREFIVIWIFRCFQRMLYKFKNHKIYNHLFYTGNFILDKNYPPLYDWLCQPDKKESWNYDFKVDYFHAFPVDKKGERAQSILKRLGKAEAKIALERANWRWDYVEKSEKRKEKKDVPSMQDATCKASELRSDLEYNDEEGEFYVGKEKLRDDHDLTMPVKAFKKLILELKKLEKNRARN